MMSQISLEQELCQNYLARSEDEQPLDEWIKTRTGRIGLLVAEGFEQRSLGILERLARTNRRLSGIVIGRYTHDNDLNMQYRERFETLAEVVSPGRWRVFDNLNNGQWVQAGLECLEADDVILDISGISNRGLLGALDVAADSSRNVFVGYSEANEYWPKKGDWHELEKGLSDNARLAEMVDEKPWLFSYEHKVEIIPGHEGYDAAGAGRALIAFLPFKCARLAAVLGEEDYREFLFIAGRPRLKKNAWRLDALRRINSSLTREWPVMEMSTFAYRSALSDLASRLFSEESLLCKYDAHLAITGSKLQVVACWVLSRIIRSLTVVTSVPARYYRTAFSEGIGESWVFRLVVPHGELV
jgi:hypothetical protein